jgi:hypothetical protein
VDEKHTHDQAPCRRSAAGGSRAPSRSYNSVRARSRRGGEDHRDDQQPGVDSYLLGEAEAIGVSRIAIALLLMNQE